jgi:hypothetical protein
MRQAFNVRNHKVMPAGFITAEPQILKSNWTLYIEMSVIIRYFR